MELSDGSIRHYRGCLVSFLGDTPASSLVGGFKEGVGGAYRCCRTCMITSGDLSSTVSKGYVHNVIFYDLHNVLDHVSLMKLHCD